MANFKMYYLSTTDFDTKIKNAKMPLQQIQIYRALAKIGKPTRGVDVIAAAVKDEGLITRQDHAVLAAWYFSPKRRPDCVRLGEPTIVEEDLADKVTRLTAELEAKANELHEAEQAWLKMAEEEAKNEEPGNEDKPADVKEEDKEEPGDVTEEQREQKEANETANPSHQTKNNKRGKKDAA